MKRSKVLLLLIGFLWCSQIARSQTTLVGRVVDVLDGRTVVLEIATGRITAVLQHIDVPIPEQPFHETVKDHLRKLTLNKRAEFLLVGMTPDKAVGRLQINGTDISQQMLRDGAAKLEPFTLAGRSIPERAVYESNEAQARLEQRGLWSPEIQSASTAVTPENLDPQNKTLSLPTAPKSAWASQTPGRPRSQGRPQSPVDLDVWKDVYARSGTELPGLLTHYDQSHKIGAIYTSNAFVTLAAGTERQRVECRTIFSYKDWPDGSRDSLYLIGFHAISEDFNFSKRRSRLTVVADKHAISLGAASGFRGQMLYGTHELFFYKVSRQSLIRIARAKSVEIRIDGFTGKLEPHAQALIKQLVDAAE